MTFRWLIRVITALTQATVKPGSAQLQDLLDDFTRLVMKVSPNIEVVCFFEERDTYLSDLPKLGLGSFFDIMTPSKLAKFVTKKSATLEGFLKIGLAANHRDLVKFESAQEPHFPMVRNRINICVSKAPFMVKKRMNDVRDIYPEMMNEIEDALDAPRSSTKREELLQDGLSPSSWITKDPNYVAWIAESDCADDCDPAKPVDCLWVRGHEGRGKTSASLAAINDFDQEDSTHWEQGEVLLAYFFCDPCPSFGTAEDVLKSLVRQLIRQQPTLAPCARSLIKKTKGRKSQPQITIENLWKALQGMLADPDIEKKVIFVLNNLHVLPENSASTHKLMEYLTMEVSGRKLSSEICTQITIG